jgi:hypothetical protein
MNWFFMWKFCKTVWNPANDFVNQFRYVLKKLQSRKINWKLRKITCKQHIIEERKKTKRKTFYDEFLKLIQEIEIVHKFS